MSTYDEIVKAIRASLPAAPQLRDFVGFATRAPSSRNTRPWTFRPQVHTPIEVPELRLGSADRPRIPGRRPDLVIVP